MLQSQVSSGQSYLERLQRVCNTVETFLAKTSGTCFMSKEKTYLATQQQAASSINFQNPGDQLLYNVIIDHCIKAERMGPGAFMHTLRLSLKGLQASNNETSATLVELQSASFRPTWLELQTYLKRLLDNELLHSILIEALDLAGLEGRIFIERTWGTQTSIEKVNGYNFNVKLPTAFAGTKQNVKVVVVDGLVESVSEIHHLLQRLSETKDTVLFVGRGFADDVIHTLKVNQARQTLNVIPAVVKYDFDGLNVLNDIALVCGTDVVSAMKGQLISTINADELPTVSLLSCQGSTMTIVNNKSLARTQLQVKALLEKSKEVELDQFKKVYDDRVRSLTPSSVRIRIADDRSLSEYTEKFDVVLRVVRSSLQHGFFSQRLMRKSFEALRDFPDPVPFDTVVASFVMSERCVTMLKKIQTVVV